jgi:hypothetical protein
MWSAPFLIPSLGFAASVVHDLTPLHDPVRVLVNPHKGWYHHVELDGPPVVK